MLGAESTPYVIHQQLAAFPGIVLIVVLRLLFAVVRDRRFDLRGVATWWPEIMCLRVFVRRGQ